MFENAKLKIKRANKHIADFNEVVNAFVKSDFCSLSIETNADTGQNVLQFRQTREPPCELPMILGVAPLVAFPTAIVLMSFLAFFIGTFLQLLWEDIPITEPL